MQEFPQWGACSPAGNAGFARFSFLMEMADQRRQYMAVCGVVIVPWAIKVGWHQAEGVKAVLVAQRRTELETGDLGYCIPVVGGLQARLAGLPPGLAAQQI